MIKNNFKTIEDRINVIFKNKDLLQQVFVHRSYLNENPNFNLDHNERLEFLGDAVLELIVTEYLYNHYKNPEGELTNWRSALVKGQMLSNVANKLEMDDYLLLSKGEEKSTGKSRQIILANTFEALVGALFLDQGYKICKVFIENNLIIYLKEIIEKELFKDAKSRLQEISQETSGITPIYKVESESGPDHEKSFDVGVYIESKKIGMGNGKSKQEAEQMAAENALEELKDM
jgi:ribonuclease-3